MRDLKRGFYPLGIAGFFLLFASCSYVPSVEFVKTYLSSEGGEWVSASFDGISFSGKYVDSKEMDTLFPPEENPYLLDGTPMTVFEVKVENGSNYTVELTFDEIYLLAYGAPSGQGKKQYRPYTPEFFQTLYPRDYTYRQDVDPFGRPTITKVRSEDFYKKIKVRETIFPEGRVLPGASVGGLIPFPPLKGEPKVLELLFSGVELYTYNRGESSGEQSRGSNATGEAEPVRISVPLKSIDVSLRFYLDFKKFPR